MKAARKALDVIAESIDVSVKRLSEITAKTMLAAGFASLPDELLARIFELYAENHKIYAGTEEGKDSSTTLASVCQRFRNIALRLPALWEIVAQGYSPEHKLMRKSRSHNPRVFVHFLDELEEAGQISEYIEELHPNNQWQELDICYNNVEEGQITFEGIHSNVRSPFESLRSLSITNHGFRDDHDNEQAAPPTQLTESSNQILGAWSFPVLTSLELFSIIPRRLLCPNLKSLRLDFNRIANTTFKWDFSSLKELLSSLGSLSSLYISFYAVDSLTSDIGTRRAVLPNLRYFWIDIHGKTDPGVLSMFIGAIDMPLLTKFEVGMSGESSDNPQPARWLHALFPSTSPQRTYPSVQEFHIRSEITGPRLPYSTMFSALPKMQKLSLSLPGFKGPNLKDCRRRHNCLKELRQLQLRDCNSFNEHDIIPFFEQAEMYGELQKFELVEVENGRCWVKDGNLESLLGDKFVCKL